MRKLLMTAAALAALCGAQAQATDVAGPDCLAKDTVHVRNFHDVGQQLKEVEWGRTVTTFAISSGLKLVADHALKHAVGELRPDGSDRHSFPSRHSSWAYGLAGFVAYNLAPYSPWWGVGAHLAANCVGMQRVMSVNHFPHDIMGGVGVAVATSALSQLAGNLIFGYKNPFPCWSTYSNSASQSITVSTGISFPMQRTFGAFRLDNSLVTDVRYSLPLSRHFLLSARGSMQSALVGEAAQQGHSALNAFSLSVGAMGQCNPGTGPVAIEWRADAGYRLMNAPKRLDVGRGSAAGSAGVACTLMLTRAFSLGLDASYGIYSLKMGGKRRAVSEATVGFISRASF